MEKKTIMKLFMFLVFLFKFPLVKLSNDFKPKDLLVNVIAKVATTVYLKNCSGVRIVYEGQESEENELETRLKSITKIFSEDFIPFTIENSDEQRIVNKTVINLCTLILTDSLETFKKLFSNLTLNFKGLYTIAFASNFNQTGEVMNFLWCKQIVNVIVLSTDQRELKASTYYPFNKFRCGDSDVIQIDPENVSEFFRDKLSNLHNCPIIVGAPQIVPFIRMNSKKEVYGRDFEVAKALSKILKFKLDLQYSTDVPYYAIGSFQDLIDRKIDILIGDYFLKFTRTQVVDATNVYYNSEIVFIIPPGRELESFEKLLQPFSQTVWIVLIVFALLISIVIFMTKSEWKKIIFESRSPYLILFSIALGVSIPSFPSKSFARILVMSFVLFCLVMQSLYAGLLFTFLQSDSREKEVSSISEMLEKDFKFYTIGLVNDIMTHHPAMHARQVSIQNEDYPWVYNSLKKSSFKGAHIVTLSGALNINNLKEYNYTFKICKEIFLTLPNVIYVSKNFYLTNKINLAISHLKSSGLIEFWNAKDIGKDKLWISDGDDEPKVMTISQVVGHFQLLGGGLLLAFVSFIIEILISKLSFIKRLKGIRGEVSHFQ